MNRGEGDGAHALPWTASMKGHAYNGSVGEWAEFSATYEECLPAVLRYTLSRVPNPRVAEDLVGDTFERALRSWPTFRRRSTARTWILGIARHVITDHWRRSGQQSVSLDTVPAELPNIDQLTPEEVVQQGDDVERLKRAIAQLAAQDQDLLALRYAAELPFHEVAAVLGVQEGAVRVRMHRVMARLRALLHEKEHQPMTRMQHGQNSDMHRRYATAEREELQRSEEIAMQTNDPDSLEQRVSRVYAQIGQDIDDAALNRRLRARLMQVSTDGTMHMKRRQPHRWFAMRPFQLARRPRTRTWSRRSPLLIAAAIVSLVVAGGAYASSSLVNQLFSLFTNHTQQSVWNDQGTNVSLSQTACGETMMIQHVYADTNRIIVGYTVRGGELAFVPHVTDAGGTLFPVLDGGDSGSGPGAGVSGHIISFDSSHIGGQPNHLALHLTAPWIAAPGSVPCPQAFDFRFTVPFIASRPLDLHQTVVSEGIAVILDRVVVSPMETKVYVHTVAKPVNMPYLADLTVNGQALESGFDGWTSGDGRDTFSFRTAPNEHGEATLILSWPNSVVMASTKQRPTSGPWTFHFTLP